MRSAIADKE